MTGQEGKIVSAQAGAAGDADALRHLEQSIMGGRHWYLALLEAIGLWASAVEEVGERRYCYLIDGEAFDWLLLAERMCATVNGLLPSEEKEALLFHGRLPLDLSPAEVRGLIGDIKYRQYLNYFYGITVEEALFLAVQEEVYKERQVLCGNNVKEIADEACQRIYDAARTDLLKCFRQERAYPPAATISLAEMKEFSYWLFKYRLRRCEKARVASDTKKALKYLKVQWARRGCCGVLATDGLPAD